MYHRRSRDASDRIGDRALIGMTASVGAGERGTHRGDRPGYGSAHRLAMIAR
jgi:hypothetical protein